ncbi:MAG: hypothetical protein HKN87_05045 [Saprospiraceae bacterium]|nr:hypothetical protein [Saprospiraceae bacterium]
MLSYPTLFSPLRVISLCLISSMLGFSCTQSPNAGKAALEEITWTIPRVSETDLIDRFVDYMVPDNKDTIDQETNQLIDFIINSALDFYPSSSGIFYHIFEVGKPPLAKWGDKVTTHYEGYLLDGSRFDSSRQRGTAFKSYVGNAIPGWNYALSMLGVGGRGVFLIPAYLAYGSEGFGQLVGPNQHLRFEIELIEIIETEAKSR